MSCRGKCSPTSPKRQNAPGEAGSPSHRTIQISMERGPPGPMPQPDTFGNSYAEYAAAYGNLRVPAVARVATPGPYGYPIQQHETFGPQTDINIGWMPKDINLAELLDQTSAQMTSRFKRPEQTVVRPPSQTPSSTSPVNPQSLLKGAQAQEEPKDPKRDKARTDSIMQWFDKCVEKELSKHKDSAASGTPPAIAKPPPVTLSLSKGTLNRMAEASASQLEMVGQLRKEPDTELSDAVDHLAKAEAMCRFATAVKAAEAAALSAPPEMAEEAAAAGARSGIQTEIQGSDVHHDLEGIRPMEVIGYVGVTKPRHPIPKRK